jgi:Protein of unknown function (DUF3108)
MPLLTTILFLLLPIGENLHYTVRFGPFQVGTLDLSIKPFELMSQESTYHFVAHIKSSPGWRFLFEIDDQLESYARISDFATKRSYKKIAEFKYKAEIQADFDYQSNKIYYSDSTVVDLKPNTKDLLSIWFYFRTLTLKPDETLLVQIHADKKYYEVKTMVGGPVKVKTGIGEFNCFVIKPKTQIKQDIGIVYISDDSRKIPVMIKKKFSFGHIVAILNKIGD